MLKINKHAFDIKHTEKIIPYSFCLNHESSTNEEEKGKGSNGDWRGGIGTCGDRKKGT